MSPDVLVRRDFVQNVKKIKLLFDLKVASDRSLHFLTHSVELPQNIFNVVKNLISCGSPRDRVWINNDLSIQV